MKVAGELQQSRLRLARLLGSAEGLERGPKGLEMDLIDLLEIAKRLEVFGRQAAGELAQIEACGFAAEIVA